MMNKAGNLAGKGFSLISHVWKKAVIGCVLAAAFAGSAYALSDNVRRIHYEFYQSPVFDPAYSIAWKVMEPMFKGTQYDKKEIAPVNPLISIGEFDLNRDKLPEIIAFAQETYEEDNVICRDVNTCPHYVLEIRGKNVHTLGVIWANSVDVGDSFINGYWTIKAFTKENDPKNTRYFDTYVYDKKTDKYVKYTAPPSAKKP